MEANTQQSSSYSQIRKRKVFFDNDGNPEDLISLMLLLAMDNIEILGIALTPADCYIEDALDSTLKILSFYERNIPVAEGHIYGKNQFPGEWRILTQKVNKLPMMMLQDKDPSLFVSEPAHEFMARIIKSSSDPVTVLMTGPCSNLTGALELDPTIKEKIEEVVWMAGAVDVPGNVQSNYHDMSAEWNVYWDPKSAHKLFKTGLNITIFPLDATNNVPLTKEVLRKLAKQQKYSISNLVSQIYAISYFESVQIENIYFLWDTLSTAYLGCDQLCTMRKVELDVSTKSPNEGQTVKKPGCGQWINVADKVNLDNFYEYFLAAFRREAKLNFDL